MISETVLDKLEYRKVLSFISGYTSTELGKSELLNQKPFIKKAIAEERGNLVTEAKEILINFEYPPFGYLPNLQSALIQSKIQGTILKKNEIRQTLELAEISRKLFTF
ncbi:MAG: hypothetical protein H6613_16750 [Ignavibacteriales bacterium]|nr:hypothetical protein [Ignavibacteriales bacterium]